MKWIRRILVGMLLIIVCAGGFVAGKGYRMYQEALEEKSLVQIRKETVEDENFVSAEQLPDIYKKAVVSVEDKRFYRHQEALEEKSLVQIRKETVEDENFVSAEQLPDIYKKAVVSVEDKRFYRHKGIDPIGIARAFYHNIRARKLLEGGSTITQQVAKNFYFDMDQTVERKIAEIFMAIAMEKEFTKEEILELYVNHIYTQQVAKNFYFDMDQTVERKIAEIFMAIAMEKEFTKEEILELYVNHIYFGDGYDCVREASLGYFQKEPGQMNDYESTLKEFTKEEILELYVNHIYFGDGYDCVREASLGYFQKEPGQMNDYESTLLAGIPNAPSVYAPTKNPELAKQRQQQVLETMVKNEMLTEEEKKEILAQAE